MSNLASFKREESGDVSLSKSDQRVILHMDIDSCEIQNMKRDADLSKAIVAINSSRLVLSATKSAKALGIKRPSTLNVKYYRRKYPMLEILVVPDDKWGKPESSSKRLSSFNIMKIVQDFSARKGGFIIEMNSLDDMFIDLTVVADAMAMANSRNHSPHNFKIPKLSKFMRLELESGTVDRTVIRRCLASRKTDPNMNLIMGALIAQEIANEIILQTGFRVSFGVGNNKTLAKTATTLHRPRGITILPKAGFSRVAEYVAAKKLTGMGGETAKKFFESFGDDCTISKVREISSNFLTIFLGNELKQIVSKKLYADDDEPVKHKTKNKSISCGKKLDCNDSRSYMHLEIINLCEEMLERNIKEEIVFNSRIGIRFKMDVAPWFAHMGLPTYSSSLDINPIKLQLMAGTDMASIILKKLEEAGFKIGEDISNRLTLSVTQFADYPPNPPVCF